MSVTLSLKQDVCDIKSEQDVCVYRFQS